MVAVAVGMGAALRLADAWLRRPLEAFGGFFNALFAVFSNRDFAVLMGVQFLVQAGQGVIQGAIGKSIAFGGKEGFDMQNVPSADYLLKVVLALYVPYTLLSPFIGVFIDRFARRRVVWWTNLITSAIVVGGRRASCSLPLGDGTTEGDDRRDDRADRRRCSPRRRCVRVILAVKSAAIPDVLSGKDLLQGNALSQAGGALFQIFGIAFALGAAGLVLPAWLGRDRRRGGADRAAIVAKQMHHVERAPHETTFGQEASQVVHNVVAGIKEIASPAAGGARSVVVPDAALPVLGLRAVRVRAVRQEPGDGGRRQGRHAGARALGARRARRRRARPGRWPRSGRTASRRSACCSRRWRCWASARWCSAAMVSVLGFAVMLFVGFFSFFMGKISADTITQQAMPDDFRGRAFALFDIAYNLGLHRAGA